MRRSFVLLLIALANLGWLAQSAPKATLLEQVVFSDVRFAVVQADLRLQRLELHWKNPLGAPYRSLSALEDFLIARGERPLALMNAGIYDTSNRPLGLHIERSKVWHALNERSKGYGNFYLQPNGVFLLERGKFGQVQAKLLTTAAFQHLQPKALEATQSGPMLLVDGQVNALFRRGSSNQIIRNAIGVCGPSRVALVLALEPTNFETLARLFRDQLKCKDALYLDGNVSAMRVPGTDLLGDGDFGGMVALLER